MNCPSSERPSVGPCCHHEASATRIASRMIRVLVCCWCDGLLTEFLKQGEAPKHGPFAPLSWIPDPQDWCMGQGR